MVKNLPAMQEARVQSLGQEDPLEKGMATYSRLLCPWNSPGTNTGVGSHSLLQRIFLTQESNPGLLHHRQILYHLSHQRSTLHSLPMTKLMFLLTLVNLANLELFILQHIRTYQGKISKEVRLIF